MLAEYNLVYASTMTQGSLLSAQAKVCRPRRPLAYRYTKHEGSVILSFTRSLKTFE